MMPRLFASNLIFCATLILTTALPSAAATDPCKKPRRNLERAEKKLVRAIERHGKQEFRLAQAIESREKRDDDYVERIKGYEERLEDTEADAAERGAEAVLKASECEAKCIAKFLEDQEDGKGINPGDVIDGIGDVFDIFKAKGPISCTTSCAERLNKTRLSLQKRVDSAKKKIADTKEKRTVAWAKGQPKIDRADERVAEAYGNVVIAQGNLTAAQNGLGSCAPIAAD